MLLQKGGDGEVPHSSESTILWMIDNIIWYNFRNCYSNHQPSIKHECPAINPRIAAVRQTNDMCNTAETVTVEESTSHRNIRNTI